MMEIAASKNDETITPANTNVRTEVRPLTLAKR